MSGLASRKIPLAVSLAILFAAVLVVAHPATAAQTIMGLAGHVSQRMLAHYSHIRMEAMREAVDVLGGRRKPVEPPKEGPTEGSYDTKRDTNQPAEQPASLQPAEN